MKRFMVVAVLAVALAALLAGTALAAEPMSLQAQGFGPGSRMQGQGAGVAGACPMGGGRMMSRGTPAWAGQPDEVAALLDMTAEAIQAERQAGKSLAEIAASKGVGVDTLVDTILSAKKALLAEAVTDGRLSQAQADLMIEHMQAQVKVMVERTTTGPMMGRGRGMRGPGRGGFNF